MSEPKSEIFFLDDQQSYYDAGVECAELGCKFPSGELLPSYASRYNEIISCSYNFSGLYNSIDSWLIEE